MDELLKQIPGFLTGTGVAGVVLYWFMSKFTPENQALRKDITDGFSKMASALDRSTKADLLRLISSPHVADAVKENARSIVAEIEAVATTPS